MCTPSALKRPGACSVKVVVLDKQKSNKRKENGMGLRRVYYRVNKSIVCYVILTSSLFNRGDNEVNVR